MTVIVLHGVESTGKSTLAARLARHYGVPLVPEYGRTHAEAHGTAMDEADLLLIGATQSAMIERARGHAASLVIADTDALMTAAWARMMIGHIPDPLMAAPRGDLYLHLEPDTDWIPDSVRIYGHPHTRARFDRVCRDVLESAGVRHLSFGGDWDARFARAVDAIEALTPRNVAQPFDLGGQSR